MRKYPKKCPICGEYGEPVFNCGFSTIAKGPSEPAYWTCDNCEKDFNYPDDDD
jgi:transposase-like protein